MGHDVGSLKVDKMLETRELNISWLTMPAMCLTQFKYGDTSPDFEDQQILRTKAGCEEA